MRASHNVHVLSRLCVTLVVRSHMAKAIIKREDSTILRHMGRKGEEQRPLMQSACTGGRKRRAKGEDE